jgi:hypothetical protein
MGVQGSVRVDSLLTFFAIAQGNKPKLSEVRRTLLHTLDNILRKLDDLDDKHCQEPASTNKKLKQGNAYWETHKMVLGYIIDMILTHPPASSTWQGLTARHPLRSALTSKVHLREGVATYLGRFCFMAIALSGSSNYFSLFQEAPCINPKAAFSCPEVYTTHFSRMFNTLLTTSPFNPPDSRRLYPIRMQNSWVPKTQVVMAWVASGSFPPQQSL